ncbi:MAG: NAD(+) synthase, partial [Clostridia bacterium]|nr:NAD(+) synthase [Clostridia bacterium]
MKYGFVKTAACSPEIKVADCAFNAASCVKSINGAAQAGASVVLLPRLCLTGATCGDLFLSRRVCDAALKALLFVTRETAKSNCVSVLGLPMRLDGEIYDCAAVISRGVVLGIVPRTASEGVFSAGKTASLNLDGKTVLFSPDLVFRYAKMPDLSFNIEIDEKKAVSAPLALVLSAQPETTVSESARRAALTARSADEKRGFVFCSAGPGESTGDGVYAGHKMIIENGVMLAEGKPFGDERIISEPDLDLLSNICKKKNGEEVVFDISVTRTRLTRVIEKDPFAPSGRDLDALCEKALAIQTEGLKKRMLHTRSKKAVIGVSGGLDSTLALIVAARACSPEGVFAVTMPCFGTSERTKSNAEKLCEKLDIPIKKIDISESVKKHFEDIGHPLEVTNVTFENAQARERTQILFDIANDVGGLVVGTGDLSELALGFATYNGDHMSSYAVNASVPKTFMRHIIRHVAK